jgi:hypothetical protein
MSESQEIEETPAMRVGDWRYCPACGGLVTQHWAGIGPSVIDGVVDAEDLGRPGAYEDVVCAGCDRTWPACPCDTDYVQRGTAPSVADAAHV